MVTFKPKVPPIDPVRIIVCGCGSTTSHPIQSVPEVCPGCGIPVEFTEQRDGGVPVIAYPDPAANEN